jgi:hypothetical protein
VTDQTFTAHMRGDKAAEITLGGVDLLRSTSIRGVDLYLRANHAPEVVIRPVVDKIHVDIEGGDGKEPRYVLAPDIGVILTELGWASPETVEAAAEMDTKLNAHVATLQEDLDNAHAELANTQDQVRSLQSERDRLAEELAAAGTQVAKLEDELATAQGVIQDLELANATLSAELEATKATQDRLTHPYDITAVDDVPEPAVATTTP